VHSPWVDQVAAKDRLVISSLQGRLEAVQAWFLEQEGTILAAGEGTQEAATCRAEVDIMQLLAQGSNSTATEPEPCKQAAGQASQFQVTAEEACPFLAFLAAGLEQLPFIQPSQGGSATSDRRQGRPP